jgi:ATP-dependent DNA ligase
MKIGTPIKPMGVAEYGKDKKRFSQILNYHNGKTLSEIKYNGYRMQIHKLSKNPQDIKLFTKNSELDPLLFPDLQKYIPNEAGIYDAELVGFGNKREQLDAMSNRTGSMINEYLLEKYPLQLRFFDILQIKDEELINLQLTERRKILENYVGNVSEQKVIFSPEDLEDRFNQTTGAELEGLVCKDPNSLYLPGAKTKSWIKIKNFISVDLVVLGIYQGEGKASKLPFAALLTGTKNKDNYETICKIGISNRDLIGQIQEKIKYGLTKEVPENIILSNALERKTFERKVPMTYVKPENSVILEVEALNVTRSKNWHSCGLKDEKAYSLLIAHPQRVREDKNIRDCTTTQEIELMYI